MNTICINKQFYGKIIKLYSLEYVKNSILNIITLLNSEGFFSNQEYDVLAFNYTLPLNEDGTYKLSPNSNAYEIKAKREDGLIFYCFLVDTKDIQHGWIFDIKYEAENIDYDYIENLRSKIIKDFYSLYE